MFSESNLPRKSFVNFEKKCDLFPLFLVSLVFLYPSVKPKSAKKFEFFNAYNGLDTFSRDFGDQKYYVLGEGLSFLCEKIGNSIKTQGGTIYLNKMVKDVVKCDTCYNVCCDVGDYLGKKIIFAIKPHQMEMFSILKPVKHLFKSVKAGKLLRIYAKFPIYKDGVWFKNMNRITTNSFLCTIGKVIFFLKSDECKIKYIDF